MRKMTMSNFCINFLNKAEKSLPILYDFAVASLADAWIKTRHGGICGFYRKINQSQILTYYI